MRIEIFWARALCRAVIEGDMIHGSFMAGQSVSMVKAIEPYAQILGHLIQ